MGTKPQRRLTLEQARASGTSVAQVTAMLVAAAVRRERRRSRWHLAALWVAVILGTVLGVVL